MKKTPEIARATDHDFLEMLGAARESDKLEAYQMTGMNFTDALEQTVKFSDRCFGARLDGELVAMFGVVPVSPLDATGTPWLVGTKLVETHSRAFAVESRYYFTLLTDGYALLENFVSADNHVSIRWLKYLGFTIDEPKPIPPLGCMFHRFWRVQCV